MKKEPELISSDSDSGRRFAHPAFGQISLSVAHHSTQALYGSDIGHQRSIVLRVSQSMMTERKGSVRYNANMLPLIEIALSDLQWGRFVSSINQADGIPCTLLRLPDGPVDELPIPKPERRWQTDFNTASQKTLHALDELESMISNSAQSGRAKDALIAKVREAKKVLNDELPFLSEQFNEHMESVAEDVRSQLLSEEQSRHSARTLIGGYTGFEGDK